MGSVGTGDARDRRLACHVQQPELPGQPRTARYAARGLERKAQPRIKRSDPKGPRANATRGAGTKSAGREPLEARLAAQSRFDDRLVVAGAPAAPVKHWANCTAN